MTIPPALALPLVCLLAVLAARRAFAALRESQIVWGAHMALVVDRRRHPAAFWFSVGLLVFAFLGLSVVSFHLVRALLTGA